jgi:3-oxoacyl-(acyl-carrier-protein) synthase
MEKPTSLSAEKRALLELRLKGAIKKAPTDTLNLARRDHVGPAPLSFAQFYIWASERAVPGNPAYNLPYGFRIKGELNVEALERSLNAVIRRHEILRTNFAISDGSPVQVVHPDARIAIDVVHIDGVSSGQREARLQELVSEETAIPFDLSQSPLIRATVYVLGEVEHVLVITLHHIAGDGLSLGPLMRELSLLYAADISSVACDLPELAIQYADYAEWIRRRVASGTYDAQADYWRRRLAGRLTPMALPYDQPRPVVRSGRGGNVYFSIPAEFVARLNALNSGPGASFFTAALAAFQVLLHRCSGAEDFLILTPVSVRNQGELKSLIGDFLNLVPLRCNVSGQLTFSQVLGCSRESTLDALSNKDLPFDRIAGGITMDRESGRDPVFQSLLQVLPETSMSLGDLQLEPYDIDYRFAQFDLSLHLYERNGGYRGRFEYSTEVFLRETIERLSANFLRLLEDASAPPERPVGALEWPHLMERKTFAPTAVKPQAHVAPQGKLEQQIAAVWRELLSVDQVGVNDNFFDLGGHSLLLVKTCERLSAELERDLRVVDLFTYPTVAALARHIGGGSPGSGASSADAAAGARPRVKRWGEEPIAIIGMAGRFPGARDVASFWANLRAGKESIRFFSAEELREAGVPEEVLSDPNYVRAYGYLDDVDLFDASFFGYSSRDAEILDPQERLLLQVANETLELAGYDPDRYPGLIGVYAGSQMNRYLSSARPQHVPLGAAGWESTALASHGDFLTTRISYKLNLRGPSVNVQTACSTSLVAVHQACRALQVGECDMALAGGVAIVLPQKCGVMFVEGGIFSRDGHCRAFDANATGTVGGNGVGLVLLKRLSDAIDDGDHIHAVIRGAAVNNDGAAKAGYTAPGVEGQAQVIALAQAAGNCDPDSIGYIEAHGTATALGDPIEITALRRVFGDKRNGGDPCYIGSVKTNVGHLFAAAGVAGLIKATLSLEHRELVPSLNFEKPNPQIDFSDGPFRICNTLRPWTRNAASGRRQLFWLWWHQRACRPGGGADASAVGSGA